MKKIILIVLVLTSISYSMQAPETPYQGLEQALEIYSLGRYNEAYNMFKFLSELYALDEHHTIFKFMAIKSLYKNGNLDKAREELNRFIKKFPGSSYLSTAYLYLGHIAYRNNNYLESAVNYLKAADVAKRSKAGRIAADNLAPLLDKELTLDEISSLIDNYPRTNLAGDVMFYLGKNHYDNKRYKRAVRVFEKYLDNFRSGKHTSDVKKMLNKAVKEASKKVIIGVLAPLSGSYADYGKSLIEGIKLVFDDFSQVSDKEIELKIMDTYGSPVYATKAVRTLAREEPVAIIGPLRSESAVGAAIVSSYNGIPLITPTASENGITELGQNVYQISPPAESIAEALAEYAVTELGIKEFGIIAPGDFTGRQVSRAFAQKVYQLGGEVLSSTFYELGQSDFSNQIKPLREILLMKTEEILADTTNQIDSTLYYDFEKEEWFDQEDWRVFLGGLFLPGYSEELSLLVPQIRYHVISSQYLGLDGWDSQNLLEKIERYIDGSIFATDYHPGSEGKIWNDFYLKYYIKYEHEPNRVSALAYDAANLIKFALEDGAYTAEAVNSYLSSVDNYQGSSCVINFKTSGNANNAVSIYKIDDNNIDKIK